ncbi:MAG: ATP-dependent RecD-like DNA helicase [Eubacterium sp.]|nr:ATP-dependent RecD-like DNA helicase [Eubacterium sp.]
MIAEGYIERIIFHSEETGYSVFLIELEENDRKNSGDSQVNTSVDTLVGNVPGIAEGMYIQAEGDYVNNPQYGLQFKIESYELSMPTDKEGIVRFLGSGVIKGVGEVLAKRIVKKFGNNTLKIIEEEPEKLAEVSGISKRMAIKISEKYEENSGYRGAIMFLSKYNISLKNSMKIYNAFGDQIYETIRRNPYRIADKVPGIGFKIVDRIAMQTGVPEDSEFRIRSAVLFTLGQTMLDGHMFIPENLLRNEVYNLISSEMDMESFDTYFHRILMEMNGERKVVIKNNDQGSVVYSSWNYYIEVNSADKLLDLRFKNEVPEEEIMEAIRRVEKEEKIELAEEQQAAVSLAVSSGFSVITGGPGTGKTTIINAVIKYFEYRGEKVLLAAPTGRAAKRITESTGYKAQTIHRLLEFSGIPDDDGEKASLNFVRNEDNPLETDVIIIDEASMIDASLFYALLKSITPGTRLVLVGDIDQLPSVGAGNVLKDIIASDRFPVTILNKIFRQSDDSNIITNAHKIKDGIHLEIKNESKDFFFIPRNTVNSVISKCKELVTSELPDYLGISPQEIEVITPMRKGDLGCRELNKALQKAVNPFDKKKPEKDRGEVIFRQGDKVMQIKNNYKLEWTVYSKSKADGYVLDQGVGVFNGDMGTITSVNDFDEIIEVTFDDGRIVEYEYNQLDELEHSFAITVHKSQGSEYPVVVIPLLTWMDKLMSRNLLYTAVTRAKNMVVIVGNPNLVNAMIDNVIEQKRYTSFAERICEIDDNKDKDEYLSLFEEDMNREEETCDNITLEDIDDGADQEILSLYDEFLRLDEDNDS